MPDDAAESSVAIPRELFDRLVQVQDLSELKAILCVIRFAGSATNRPVPSGDLLAPEAARTIAGPHNPEDAQQRAQRAVDRAVTNGSLFRITVGAATNRETYVVPVTTRTRTLVERLRSGDGSTVPGMGFPSEANISVYRPNVFAFYEQYLGPLTPLVADQLRDAERSYPRLWIEEAILAAADSQTRSWRYIETMLTRWEETGAPER
jgi:DNA replication protein